MLKLNSIMLGSHQQKRLGDFYEAVFNQKPNSMEEGWYSWDFDGLNFSVGSHSEVGDSALDPKRIMLNIEAEDVKSEFERIKNLPGAEVIKEPYTMEGWEGSWIATLTDPDGNYFQLMTPWSN